MDELEIERGINLGEELVTSLGNRGIAGEFTPRAAVTALVYAIVTLSYRTSEPGNETEAIKFAIEQVDFIGKRMIARVEEAHASPTPA